MERRRLLQWIFTVMIFTAGLALSVVTYQGLRKSDEARVLAELQKETYQQSVRASLLFTRATQILNSFSALFTVSDAVSRREFELYSSYLVKSEQEIAAIMWTPYVLAKERKQYEAILLQETGQQMGFIDIKYPDHRRVKSASRDFYLPIFYGEPKGRTGNFLGIDLNGRTTNRELRMAAMRSGLVVTTPVFSELTDPHGASMIAIYHPVYKSDPTQRDDPGRFIGFMLMLMTPEVLMRTEFGDESQSRFFMRLIDKDDQDRLIAVNRKDQDVASPEWLFRYDLPMPARHWSLEIYSREPIRYDKTAIFLLLCMLILTLGATLVFYRGIAHFIKLKTKNATLELQRRELKQRANFDSLTGLHNRRYFQDKVSSLLNQPDREYEIAICLLDLDNFKQMNDLFGHQLGDELLKRVGEALLRETRLGDQVARLGGDEFALALPLTQNPQEIHAVLDRLLALIPQIGDELSNHAVRISASVGITISSASVCDYDNLMHQADLAMYAAKRRGKNTYTFFSPDGRSMG